MPVVFFFRHGYLIRNISKHSSNLSQPVNVSNVQRINRDFRDDHLMQKFLFLDIDGKDEGLRLIDVV